MGANSLNFLRLTTFITRLLQFLASVLILGIFSYFLATRSDHNMKIPHWISAVEGMSGAATVYTLAVTILTLPLGGHPTVAFIGFVMDIVFIPVFVAIAICNRHCVGSCKGTVNTALGKGSGRQKPKGFGSKGFGTGKGENVTYMVRYSLACKLQKAAFAACIIAIILLILSIFLHRAYSKDYKLARRAGLPNIKSRAWGIWPFHHTAADEEKALQERVKAYNAKGYANEPGSDVPVERPVAGEHKGPMRWLNKLKPGGRKQGRGGNGDDGQYEKQGGYDERNRYLSQGNIGKDAKSAAVAATLTGDQGGEGAEKFRRTPGPFTRGGITGRQKEPSAADYAAGDASPRQLAAQQHAGRPEKEANGDDHRRGQDKTERGGYRESYADAVSRHDAEPQEKPRGKHHRAPPEKPQEHGPAGRAEAAPDFGRAPATAATQRMEGHIREEDDRQTYNPAEKRAQVGPQKAGRIRDNPYGTGAGAIDQDRARYAYGYGE